MHCPKKALPPGISDNNKYCFQNLQSFRMRRQDHKDEQKTPPISMRWSGNEFSDEMLAFYKINKAKTGMSFAMQ